MSKSDAQLRAKGVEMIDIAIRVKSGKPLPNAKDVISQIKKWESAVNAVVKAEGIIGLKGRIQESAQYRNELNKLNAEIRKSLGYAGDDQAWLHEADTVILGEPFAIKGSGDGRTNSIMGANNKRIANEILALPNDTEKLRLRVVLVVSQPGTK